VDELEKARQIVARIVGANDRTKPRASEEVRRGAAAIVVNGPVTITVSVNAPEQAAGVRNETRGHGVYFTPRAVIERIVEELPPFSDSLLDPTRGTSAFLRRSLTHASGL